MTDEELLEWGLAERPFDIAEALSERLFAHICVPRSQRCRKDTHEGECDRHVGHTGPCLWVGPVSGRLGYGSIGLLAQLPAKAWEEVPHD